MDHVVVESANEPDRGVPRSLKLFAAGVASLLALACVALSLRLIGRAKYSGEDSWFPMFRALDLLHGPSGSRIYETLFFSGHIKFQYPPSGLLLIDLMRELGITTSAQYNTINAGLLIITGLTFAIFAVQMLGSIRFYGFRLVLAPVSYLIAIRFYPNYLAFQFGQIQVLLGLLVLLACLARINNRCVIAGCLIAAAATVKPQLALLSILALWHRDWGFFRGFAVVFVAASALSITLYGWDNNLDYLKVLAFLSQHGEYHHLNQSINGILNRSLYHGPSVDQDPENPIPNSGFPPYIAAVYLSVILSSLVMIAIPFAARMTNSGMSRILNFCLAITLFTMASPIAWVHHYNVLVPVFVVALRAALDRLESWRLFSVLVLLLTSFILVAFPLTPPFGPTVPEFNLLQSHVFIGACILVGIMLRLICSQEQLPHSDLQA